VICDGLGDVATQMDEIARIENNATNTQNLDIVRTNHAAYEQEWLAIKRAGFNEVFKHVQAAQNRPAAFGGVLAYRRFGVVVVHWLRARLPGNDPRHRARAWLSYERTRMDLLVARRRLLPDTHWERLYELARFGPPLSEAALGAARRELRDRRVTMSRRPTAPRTLA
jgi:hypothetical protein